MLKALLNGKKNTMYRYFFLDVIIDLLLTLSKKGDV